MTAVTLDDALQARIRAVAAPEEDLQDFIAAAGEDRRGGASGAALMPP